MINLDGSGITLWGPKYSDSKQNEFVTIIQIVLVVLWSLLLLLGIHNTYIYLYKMKKYSFAPMFIFYSSTLIVCSSFIVLAIRLFKL